IRHGLDMAFSSNLNQLLNWGSHFQIDINGAESPEELAVHQLDLWIKSTRLILEMRQSHPDRIYLLRHDGLCLNPEPEIEELMAFCKLEVNGQTLKQLAQIPDLPSSHNRYKGKGLHIFRSDQLNDLQELGFAI
ncbi:MAG: hypothetical protein ACPF9D_13290, partial [Owenweeksia sp.]